MFSAQFQICKAQQKGAYRRNKTTEQGIYKMFDIWERMVT